MKYIKGVVESRAGTQDNGVIAEKGCIILMKILEPNFKKPYAGVMATMPTTRPFAAPIPDGFLLFAAL